MPRKSDRVHRQGLESRKRILDAAFMIASERGYDGTTLALVTERAGLPASSVYWQFRSKDELLAAALDQSYADWRESRLSWADHPSAPDFEAQLASAMHEIRYNMVNQPSFQRLGLLLALQQHIQDSAARGRFEKIRVETIARVAKWWAEILPPRTLTLHPFVPEDLARLMMVVSDGMFVSTHIDVGLDIDRLMDMITTGIRAVVAGLVAEVAD